ncbi:MAG: flagellar FliJ family protein [Rhodospirillales bacterium]|nr:flagellar FliJ family protein [Rhodospirillales bacterium]
MTRDPLQPVLRLRRLALEAALRDLAAALRQEAACAQTVAALEAAIAQETAAAASLAGDDSVVEAFGVWLRRTRRELDGAAVARDAAGAEVELGRAVLAAARAAVRAAETLAASREAEQCRNAARQEQKDLDEIAGPAVAPADPDAPRD